MTDTPEESNDDEICEHEYHAAFLERTLHNLFVGMEALDEVCDRLKAENAHLKSVIEMGSKHIH